MNKISAIIIAFFAFSALSAADSSSNRPSLINSDGCLCKITAPEYVCAGESFTAHAKVYMENGSTDSHTVDYKVKITGMAGATISPNTITLCPSETDLECYSGDALGGGELTISVGNCTHKVKVLTQVAGSWSNIRDPNPTLPTPNPEVVAFTTPPEVVPPGFFTLGYTKWSSGNHTSTFSIDRKVLEWKPNINGTDCGSQAEIIYTETFNYAIGGDVSVTIGGGPVSVTIPTGGVGYSWENTITMTKTLGPESNKRFRAYPVVPMVESVTTGRIYQDFGVGTTSSPFTKNNGRAAIAGKDWYVDAACCR